MKRVIIALLCFTISTSWAHANIFSIGPRIGLSVSQVKVNPPEGSTAHETLQLKDGWGYHLGIFTRFDLFAVYIQPEVLITGSGAKFSQGNKEFKLSFNKLDVPAMVGLSFLGFVRAQLGPVFSLLISATEGETDVKNYYNRFTVGWQGGLGVDIWNMVIDLKYEGSLSSFGEKIAGIDTKHGHALWMLSLGFNIL